MMVNLFNQFDSPLWMGIPLLFIALLIPYLLYPSPQPEWLSNRIHNIISWFSKTLVKELMTPLAHEGRKWALMLTSLTVFLITMNVFGLLPYTFTPTTQLSVNLGIAVPLWLATVLTGTRKQFSQSIAHLLPVGTPTLLIPILVIIETISLFIRPLALGVRLTANLTAGHLLIHLISMAALFASSISTSILIFIVLILLTLLEIAVALIQAYVFVLLLSLYLQENTEHTSHSD
uniref:ATP synthase subunit a n=1 Tax=Eleutherodactylus atkinsi TaxID=448426 RepID=S4V150_9NEOB|nr:ATP synthase F0 subunit 6 [Eleutherodactylus atkinsi]